MTHFLYFITESNLFYFVHTHDTFVFHLYIFAYSFLSASVLWRYTEESVSFLVGVGKNHTGGVFEQNLEGSLKVGQTKISKNIFWKMLHVKIQKREI